MKRIGLLAIAGFGEMVKTIVIPRAMSNTLGNREITVNGNKSTPKKFVQDVLNAKCPADIGAV